MISYHI